MECSNIVSFPLLDDFVFRAIGESLILQASDQSEAGAKREPPTRSGGHEACYY